MNSPRSAAWFALALGACSSPRATRVVAPPPVAHASHTALAAPPPTPGRLPDTAVPLRYTLALRIDPSTERFSGVQRIALRIARPTTTLVLDARSLTLEHIALTLADGTTHPAHATHERPGFEQAIDFGDAMPAGDATLEIAYSAAFNDQSPGLFRVASDGAWYAFTDFEPADARRAFPCFDEPGFKVPWEVSVTVPTGLAAFANMPEASRADDAAQHTTTVRFAPTPPTASYLVALAVGPLDVLEGPRTPVPIRAVVPRGRAQFAHEAVDAAAADLAILSDYFGRAYPYPKLDLVAVPGFEGAMENPGLVTFAESELLLDPTGAAIDARREMATTVAHELSHQWFGDLVTMAWWDDLWLNEGFATWMESRVVDQWRPAWGAREDARVGRAHGIQMDLLPTSHAVRQPVLDVGEAMASFDGITYQKGGAVLGMLEAWLGTATFRAGVRAYITAHAWGNARAQDLFAALATAAARTDVAAVAGSFVEQPGVPLITADVVCDPGAPPALALTQAPFTGTTPRLWRVPVCVLYDADGAPRRACPLLETATARVPLAGATRCPQWLDPNPGLAGYYLYALTPAVREIRRAPTWNDAAAGTRWGFFDDARLLFENDRLDAGALFAEIDAFRGEHDRRVIEAIAAVLSQFDRHYVAEADRAALRAYIAAFFRPLDRELGLHARAGEADERRLLRRTVLATLASHGNDARTVAEAERSAAAFLRDSRTVDADEIGWALPLASRHAGGARLDALLAALRRPGTSPEQSVLIAGALGSFDDPAVLTRALDVAVTDALRPNETSEALHAALMAPERRPTAVRWLREHYDAVAARLDGLTLAYLPGATASGACTQEEIDAERAFWRDRVVHLEGGARALGVGLDRATQCAAIRARAQAPLHVALARH